MYIEAIVERLNNNNLKDENNPGRQVLDGTIGEFLENFDNHFLDFFISTASGKYLDIHGNDFQLVRRENESDTAFRKRILIEKSILENTDSILNLSDNIWVFFDSVLDKNQLTSRNPYLKNKHDSGYIFIVCSSNREYIESKFLIGDILWV